MTAKEMQEELLKFMDSGEIEKDHVPKVTTIQNWIGLILENLINKEQPSHLKLLKLRVLQMKKIKFDHSNTKSLVHSNNAIQKLINTLFFHGELFYSLNQYDKALLYYNKVLEIDPFNFIASSFPFSDLEKVLEQYDKDLYNLGIEANFKLGRHKESHLNTEKLAKILEIEFNNAFILYNADINFKLRQFNKAISDLDIAINLKPNDIEMLILRGKTYFFLEKYDLALFDFIKAL
ncbi:21304_t:CDS:2, partial [Gigaspora rosea]